MRKRAGFEEKASVWKELSLVSEDFGFTAEFVGYGQCSSVHPSQNPGFFEYLITEINRTMVLLPY